MHILSLPISFHWMIGSQSCEKLFRSVRSMSGTFLTMINFNLLSILQRLHKLAIKEDIESKTEKEMHQICVPTWLDIDK